METTPLGFQWPVQEPFLFLVHHHDFFPKGEPGFGVAPSALVGRRVGEDFAGRDGFRMYHGREIPGFPVHPHRGFETITIVRQGYVDHSDSMGAAGRYGEGDVQWMTAGTGVQHSEMFPLLRADAPNTLELFQLWLNLPRRSKHATPHFTMFWSEKIPRVTSGGVSVSVIAGEFEGTRALPPPPESWAADAANEVAILLVSLRAGSRVRLPATSAASVHRTLYFFSGGSLTVNGSSMPASSAAALDPLSTLELVAVDGPCEVLFLQAAPIGEPVFQHGPFVMNTRDDIIATIEEYQRTQFGGWPWERDDMIHGPAIERFAKYPDGRVEKP